MEKPRLFGMNGLIVILLSCFCFGAYAQQAVGLILIDAEGKQPFTVRIGNQVYPSSVHGHIALSHLKDSSYRICLRFPKKALAEQVFPVNLRQKDLGFILKGEDSSWVLYNWQTKETIHPVYILDSSRILELGVKREDGFSRLMASVVNDTAVMYNSYTGSGIHGNDTSAIGHRVFPIGQASSTVNQQPSTNSETPVSSKAQLSKTPEEKLPATNHPPPVITPGAVVTPTKKPDKDSLVAVKRQQIHTSDSLKAARKAFIKDSMLVVKATKASRDSLLAVHKAYLRDSLKQAKKYTNDSLLAVKLKRDSLIAVNKKKAGGQAINTEVLPASGKASAADVGGESRMLTAAKDSQALKDKSPTIVGRQLSAVPPKKIREVSLKISRKMVFVDVNSEGKKDTITLFVYFENQEKPVSVPGAATGSLAIKNSSGPDSLQGKKSQPNARPVDSGGLRKMQVKAKSDSAISNKSAKRSLPGKTGQPSCLDLASDEDVLFLRSAILKANSNQEKIAVASGGFALKCFTVIQIRQLAALFVADKARYQLMEASRGHIADPEHFPELADMYTDKNFQRKFLVMAEKRS
jgi:hypothetical protein